MQLFDPGQIGINAMNAFKAGREEREKANYRNALSEYAMNPSEQGLATIAPHNPEFVMKERERMQKAEREQQVAMIGQQALKGDPGAMEKLFSVDPDLYMRLDTRQREELKRTNSYMGQAAMQIGKLPEEQRAAAWAQAVQQAEQGGMDIPDYLESYNPASLDTAVRMAGIVENYVKQFEPNYMAVPYDATLVNTRDPASLQQFGQGVAGNIPPPPPGFQLDQGGPTQPASGGFRP